MGVAVTYCPNCNIAVAFSTYEGEYFACPHCGKEIHNPLFHRYEDGNKKFKQIKKKYIKKLIKPLGKNFKQGYSSVRDKILENEEIEQMMFDNEFRNNGNYA